MTHGIFADKNKRPKHRMHRALFDDNLPFKPKVVKLKIGYKRHEKHRSKDESWG